MYLLVLKLCQIPQLKIPDLTFWEECTKLSLLVRAEKIPSNNLGELIFEGAFFFLTRLKKLSQSVGFIEVPKLIFRAGRYHNFFIEHCFQNFWG